MLLKMTISETLISKFPMKAIRYLETIIADAVGDGVRSVPGDEAAVISWLLQALGPLQGPDV